MSVTRVQLVGNVSTGASFAGIVTATSFIGNVTGTASTASFATTSFGLSGSPNITVGTIASGNINSSGIATATTFVGALTGTASSTTNIPNLTGAITSVGTATTLGSFSSSNLATALTDETGSGSAVFATSPTLTTPVLGTPSSGTLTSCTGLPLTTGVTGTLPVANGGTGVTAASTGSGGVVLSTSPTLTTPALGTPSSGTLTSCTGLPISGLTASTSTALGVGSIELGHASDTSITRVSAGLVAIEGVNIVTTSATQTLTNKTLTSPTLTTPALGTPASGTLSGCTVDGTNLVGYKSIPAVGTKTASYTLVLGDVGKFVELGTSGTVVVPASIFSAGDAIMIFNNTSGSISCTCSAVTTVYKGGTDADIGTFSVTTRGVANILFISATVAVITGNLA